MKKIMAMMLAAALLVSVWAVGSAENKTGRVFGGWLILRGSPSYNGAIKSSYPSGTVVQITGQSGSWYQVITPDGLTGYMLSKYLKVSGGSAPTYTTAYVTSANGLNVRLRSGPGTGYSVLASYAPGTQCTILEAGVNWCKIKIGNYTGYMMTKYLTGTQPSPQPQPQPGTNAWVTSRNGKGVNLRSGPGKGYTSIGFYSVGTSAVILGTTGAWSYIRIGSRHGYMMSEFLTTTEPTPTPIPPIVGGAYITSQNGRAVNMRTGPGMQYTVMRAFPVGTPVSVVARGDEWYFVKAGDLFGYIMKIYIYEAVTPTAGTGGTSTGSSGGTASGSGTATGSGSGTNVTVNVTVADSSSGGSSSSGAASGSSGSSGSGSESTAASSDASASSSSAGENASGSSDASASSSSAGENASGSSDASASSTSGENTASSGTEGSGGGTEGSSSGTGGSGSGTGDGGSGTEGSGTGTEGSGSGTGDGGSGTGDGGSGTGGSGSGTGDSGSGTGDGGSGSGDGGSGSGGTGGSEGGGE